MTTNDSLVPPTRRPETPGLYFARRAGEPRWSMIAMVSGRPPFLEIEHFNIAPALWSLPRVPRLVGELELVDARQFIYGPPVALPEVIAIASLCEGAQ